MTAPYDEDLKGIGERWAIDANKNTFSVPNEINYKQWKKNFIDIPLENDYNSIKDLNRTFENKAVRIWYNRHAKRVPDLIDTKQPLRLQAVQAHEIRNSFKFQARELMKNQEARKIIDQNKPLQPVEYYYEKYSKIYTNEDDIYRAIINASSRTNKKFNDEFGLG